MIWLMVNQKAQQKELNQTNFFGDKAFKIASDPKYDGYQRGLALMVYKFFDRKSSGSGVTAEPNYQLANNLIGKLLENLRDEKFIHLLETISGVLIQLICNH